MWNIEQLMSTCYITIYSIDIELARRIDKGECTYIEDVDLNLEQGGYRCSSCGYEVDGNYHICPKCGQQLEK